MGCTLCRPKTFQDSYKLGPQLAVGQYGKVHVAFHKVTGQRVAVKILERSKLKPAEEHRLWTEVQIMQCLDHPNIIRLYNFFQEEDRYLLVMEMCDGGDLVDKLIQKRRYTEEETRVVMKKLLDAVAYMHDYHIVHRDLKPENLLLVSTKDTTRIKVGDFGFAAHLQEPNSLDDMLGSPSYVAPEILDGKRYGESIDNWSIGIICYVLLGGRAPFNGSTKSKILKEVRKAEYKFVSPNFDNVSDEAKDFIRRLLVVDPSKRMTAREALKHPWVAGCSSVSRTSTKKSGSLPDDKTLSSSTLSEAVDSLLDDPVYYYFDVDEEEETKW